MFGHNKDDDGQEPVADNTLGSAAGFPGADDSILSGSGNPDDSAANASSTIARPEPKDEELLPAHATGSSEDDAIKPADEVVSNDKPAAVASDLLDIKQKALGQLSPLVNHLDQSPEERFKTIMMMIQAADNQALIPDAYEAAQAITDEKAKAQALLDVVNEINYFTQQSNKE